MNRIFVGAIPSVLLGLSALMPLNATAAGETYEQAVDRIVNQGAEMGTETSAMAGDVEPADVGSVLPPSAQAHATGVEPKPARIARPYGGIGE